MRRIFSIVLATVVLAGAAAPAGASESAKAKADPGRKIYVTKCAKCHKFYDPAKYSDAQWESWMNKMSKKAKLSPEQEKELTNYIEKTFRSEKTERTAAKRP